MGRRQNVPSLACLEVIESSVITSDIIAIVFGLATVILAAIAIIITRRQWLPESKCLFGPYWKFLN
jgi:hypothetical protein